MSPAVSRVRSLTRAFDAGEWRRLLALYGAIAAIHVAGWALLVAEAGREPALLGLGGLAYSFGLRHAFDADHIAAIDNVTRKLQRQRRRAVGTGFFFSLGHSTVVLLIALGLGFAVKVVVQGAVSQNGQLRAIGGLIGTGVSGVFLLLMGVLNLAILVDVVGTFGRMRRGQVSQAELDRELVTGGPLTRLFGRLFRVIDASWQMYPVGVLFGLGFDTASEIALLAISAGAASQGVPFGAVVALPIIFAAGMSLMDTTDGAFMAKAYSWAFSHPVRKVFYNLTMTGLSVFVALFVGGVEVAQLLISSLGLRGAVFDAVGKLDFASMGFVIVGAFVLAWALSLGVFKLRRIEERWSLEGAA